ncbi:MAG: exonuclease SbcCD subunit D [Faecousia sp.]
MIFLHTSDWHLGAAEGEHDLWEDQRFFIDEICRVIQAHQVDAVLLAGDVYDRSVASGSAIRLYDYAMDRICRELNTQVLTIAGNHDSAERLSSCGSLLKKAGLHIAGAAQREPAVVSFADAQVFLLPWITEEKVKSLYPEEKEHIQSLTDAYRVVTGYMRGQFAPDKKHIVVSHAFITDSETSTSDRAAEIGFATQVAADVFEGFDYVALGHIHKPQNVNDFIRYCGTPMPYSFGKEESQEKSVTLLDTDTMTQTVIPLPLLHKRTTLTGTFEELCNRPCTEDEKNGYVRLNVTDTAIGLELLSKLRAVYPYPLVVSGKVYEGDETTITLTMEELERMENDPKEVFKSFCREEMGEEPKPHFMDLFEKAVSAYEEGTV